MGMLPAYQTGADEYLLTRLARTNKHDGIFVLYTKALTPVESVK
jgi:hypothetical protein